ncbi:MAG: uracil-DNA glycosylase [Candidatus Aminicenantales bacterium]
MAGQLNQILDDIEERLHFFSLVGVPFLVHESPFDALEQTIKRCQKCGLSQSRRQAVPGEGNRRADLMFVGEAPGRDEDIQGRPFVGKAGQLLSRIIQAMGFRREDVYITNVVKCRPPENRTPQGPEIASCRDYLLEQIALIQPRVIVALGRVAAGFFIKTQLGMTQLRGNFHEFLDLKVMPTFHPSYLIRNEGNRALKKMVWEDMKKVMAFLGKR